MPEIRRGKLPRPDSRGHFRCRIGRKENGKAASFDLGSNAEVARRRRGIIQEFAVTCGGIWTDENLCQAKLIASGVIEIDLQPKAMEPPAAEPLRIDRSRVASILEYEEPVKSDLPAHILKRIGVEPKSSEEAKEEVHRAAKQARELLDLLLKEGLIELAD